jgi:hypothetical protein
MRQFPACIHRAADFCTQFLERLDGLLIALLLLEGIGIIPQCVGAIAVIVGFFEPIGGTSGLAELLVAISEEVGQLVFFGTGLCFLVLFFEHVNGHGILFSVVGKGPILHFLGVVAGGEKEQCEPEISVRNLH